MIDYRLQIIQILLENKALADRAYELFCIQEKGIYSQEVFIKRIENQLRKDFNFDYIIMLAENPEKDFCNLFRHNIPLILKKYIEQQKLKEIKNDFQ